MWRDVLVLIGVKVVFFRGVSARGFLRLEGRFFFFFRGFVIVRYVMFCFCLILRDCVGYEVRCLRVFVFGSMEVFSVVSVGGVIRVVGN